MATRMVELRASAANIQARLRVRILPVDSKVESSNMGCLLGDEPLRVRRAGARVGRPLGALIGAASDAQLPRRRKPVAGDPTGGLLLLFGTTVVV